jgi:Cu2+-exporting ATPase
MKTTAKINYSVVHTIPGRVRFRIPLLNINPDYAQRLQDLPKSDSRIIQVHINQLVASVVITYKPEMSDRP